MSIAEKLQAELHRGKKHDIAVVKWESVVVAQFGVRRDRRSSHPYIPQQLFISERRARELASCVMSRQQYFDMLKADGKLPPERSGSQGPR